MSIRLILLFFIASSLFACTSHIENTLMNPKREHVPKEVKGDLSEAKKTDQNVGIDEEAVPTDEMPKERTTTNLLEGKWRSVEDPSNFLLFENGQRKEIAGESTTWQEEPYKLSNKCLNDSDTDNGNPLEADKYISCLKSDMCWYIVNVNDIRLELSYMGRGNSLIYERFR